MSKEETAGNSSTWEMVSNWTIGQGKEIYTTVTQEALEASHTCVDETLKVLVVAWNDTTIETDIDPALALRGGHLDVEVLNSSRWWNGVQRHIDDRSNTTKGSSPGASPEALPFCPPGLVEMYMCVDKTRKEDVG